MKQEIIRGKYYKALHSYSNLICGLVYKILPVYGENWGDYIKMFVFTEEFGGSSIPMISFVEATEQEILNTKKILKEFINEYNIPKDGSVNVYVAYQKHLEVQSRKKDNMKTIKNLGL